MGSIPGLERSPGGGHGSPLQDSCLENPMDRGACWAIVHRVVRRQTRLERISGHEPPLVALPSAGSIGRSRGDKHCLFFLIGENEAGSVLIQSLQKSFSVLEDFRFITSRPKRNKQI